MLPNYKNSKVMGLIKVAHSFKKLWEQQSFPDVWTYNKLPVTVSLNKVLSYKTKGEAMLPDATVYSSYICAPTCAWPDLCVGAWSCFIHPISCPTSLQVGLLLLQLSAKTNKNVTDFWLTLPTPIFVFQALYWWVRNPKHLLTKTALNPPPVTMAT